MNPIAERIADFLAQFPPFQYFGKEEVLAIAKKSVLQHRNSQVLVFQEQQEPYPHFFVLYKGSVKLELKSENRLVDWAEPGDSFGVRAMLSGKPYLLTATTSDESLLIEIQIDDFKKRMMAYPKVLEFYASGLASGTLLLNTDAQEPLKAPFQWSQTPFAQDLTLYQKPVFFLNPTATLKEAAQTMVQKKVSSLLISEDAVRAIGILTDKDLRKALAEKEFPARVLARDVMSTPPHCIAVNKSPWEAQLFMVQHKIRHLPITQSGKNDEAVLGLVSEHDLLQAQQNSPLALIKKLADAQNPQEWSTLRNQAEKQLQEMLQADAPIAHLCELNAKYNHELLQNILQYAENELLNQGKIKPIEYCWLSLGSEGRKEQIARTDQDNALIFEDSDQNEENKKYFLELATRANSLLEQCGFEKCPAFVMASNPNWCMPLSAWKKQFSKWINTPEPQALMHATIFFDFRPVYGQVNLAQELENHLETEIKNHNRFLSFLAHNALQNPPPLGLLRGLQVETEGDHKNQFDLKARALMPFIDAARLLSRAKGIQNTQNTLQRYESLMQADPEKARLYEDAAKAFEILLTLRAKSAFSNDNSGRYLIKEQISPLERSILKKTFQPLADLQKMIETRFQTQYLR